MCKTYSGCSVAIIEIANTGSVKSDCNSRIPLLML